MPFASLATTNRPPVPAGVLQEHARGHVRECGGLLRPRARPLDERHGIRAEVVGQQVGVLVGQRGHPVEIDVRHDGNVLTPRIALSDRERRAGHGHRHAERATGAADEGGLAGAELTLHQDDVAGRQLGRQSTSERLCVGRAV